MSPKELLSSYLQSDLANDISLVPKYYHPDCVSYWNSSQGFKTFKYDDIYKFFKGVTESYNSLRFQISHLLEQGNKVTIRYTLYAKTIEAPDEEIPLAHYISIWEIKDNKLYRGFESSQPADMLAIESDSFQNK